MLGLQRNMQWLYLLTNDPTRNTLTGFASILTSALCDISGLFVAFLPFSQNKSVRASDCQPPIKSRKWIWKMLYFLPLNT